MKKVTYYYGLDKTIKVKFLSSLEVMEFLRTRSIKKKKPLNSCLNTNMFYYILIRCEKLNLTEYISSTEKECGSSAKTYWRLWSECHFLLCTTCKWQYPVRNSAMCQYHPENPEYFHIGNLGLEQPIGVKHL